MNKLDTLFTTKKENILSVYFSAGYPNLHDTATIIETLDKSGADLIEVGIPFSDPVADGPVIQESSLIALNNGMSLKLLFEQLSNIRQATQIPLVLMGYLNPVIQYGIEDFCVKCNEIGIDGVIIPDLPPELYNKNYRTLFEQNGLSNIMLVTPQSSDERIKQLDEWSSGFLYIVSSSSTTGTKSGINTQQIEYFQRLEGLKLKTPRLVGFGISDKSSFLEVGKYANGAIIGSAFIKALGEDNDLKVNVEKFIQSILG